MSQTHIFKANHIPTGNVCQYVCAVAQASQSERKERLGVSNVKNRHLVASGAPSISARPGPLFISRLCPGPSGAGGMIKAERYDSAVQHMGLLYVEQDSVTHISCQSQP